jgi:hypothetical protein
MQQKVNTELQNHCLCSSFQPFVLRLAKIFITNCLPKDKLKEKTIQLSRWNRLKAREQDDLDASSVTINKNKTAINV